MNCTAAQNVLEKDGATNICTERAADKRLVVVSSALSRAHTQGKENLTHKPISSKADEENNRIRLLFWRRFFFQKILQLL